LIQTCIVHLIRHSLAFASWKERREVAAALKPIYRAANAEMAREQLEAFAVGPWGARYPAIAPAWRRQWEQVVPFFAFPLEVRKIILPHFVRSCSPKHTPQCPVWLNG
jgi:transposase-like protein